MGKNEKEFDTIIVVEAQKHYLAFELILFSNGHIRNVVSTLPNVFTTDVESDNVVSKLSNIVQFKVEIDNIV